MNLQQLEAKRERDTARLVVRHFDGRNDVAGFKRAADPMFYRYLRQLRRIAPEQYEARLAELTDTPASD